MMDLTPAEMAQEIRHLRVRVVAAQKCVFCGVDAWRGADGISQHPSFHECYAKPLARVEALEADWQLESIEHSHTSECFEQQRDLRESAENRVRELFRALKVAIEALQIAHKELGPGVLAVVVNRAIGIASAALDNPTSFAALGHPENP